MKKYRSIKEVYAQPMDYHQAGSLGLIRDYNKDKENEEGYIVVYSDDYKSWSPKKAFKDGYIEITEEV